MQILIESPHVTPTEALTRLIKSKVNKLSHFHNSIENAAVFLKIEKSDSADDKVCEVKLAIPGNDLFVKKHNYTFENAVHQATAALYEQIEKIKTRFHY